MTGNGEGAALLDWPWPVTPGYPEPYPSRVIDSREAHPIITSLRTGGCWYGPRGCENAPVYLARYACGDTDEEGLVCALHARDARLDPWLTEIRSLTQGASDV